MHGLYSAPGFLGPIMISLSLISSSTSILLPPSIHHRYQSVNHTTLSKTRSFRTIYLLNPIHPHLNHLIWLICACVIAFCAILVCVGVLTNNKLSGKPAPWPRALTSTFLLCEMREIGPSKIDRYFLSSGTVVSVYSVVEGDIELM